MEAKVKKDDEGRAARAGAEAGESRPSAGGEGGAKRAGGEGRAKRAGEEAGESRPSAGGEGRAKRARRGFAAMSPEKQQEIASLGGKAAHAMGKAHEFTSETARRAGRLGGLRAQAAKRGAPKAQGGPSEAEGPSSPPSRS